MRRLGLLFAILTAVAVQPALAFPVLVSPALLQPPKIFPAKFVAAGGHVILWEVSALNPDCSSNGAVTFRILQQPQHGKVSVHSAQIFPEYPPNNPRSACNTRRVAGQQMTYAPSAGYSGSDLVEFETIYPAGMAFITRVPIVVR